MRELICNFHISLDGVVQGPGGPEEDPRNGFDLGGWSAPFEDDMIGTAIMDTLNEDYDLLLGAYTYGIWADYWPTAGDNPIANKFNSITKCVASGTLKSPSWQNTAILEGDAAAAVAALKAQGDKKLHLWGSSDFMQTLMAAGLVDEYRFWIYPVVLGKGWKLFREGITPQTLSLVSGATSPTGTFIARYRPSGAVEIGDYTKS